MPAVLAPAMKAPPSVSTFWLSQIEGSSLRLAMSPSMMLPESDRSHAIEIGERRTRSHPCVRPSRGQRGESGIEHDQLQPFGLSLAEDIDRKGHAKRTASASVARAPDHPAQTSDRIWFRAQHEIARRAYRHRFADERGQPLRRNVEGDGLVDTSAERELELSRTR